MRNALTDRIKDLEARIEILEAASSFDYYLTREAVACYLSVSKRTVVRMEKRGELRPIFIGENTIRYRKSDLDEFVNERFEFR